MKPGRNDACPCGSGKKYKRCCGLGHAVVPPVASDLNPHEIGALVASVGAGRLAEAETGARALLARHPDDGMLWKIYGVALLRQGRDAVAALRRAVELLPDDAEAYSNFGAALHDQGLWSAAWTSLRRSLELRPRDFDTLVDAASALRALARPGEAVALYRRALQVNARSVEARNDLGNALLELGQPAEALVCFEQALTARPDDAKLHNNLANALGRAGRLQESLASARRALALDARLGAAHNTLGAALAGLGQLGPAVASYRHALTLDPRQVEWTLNLGNALRDLGELKEALGCFRRAVELDPERAAGHFNLGNALLDLGQLDQAAACYSRALQLHPGLAAAHLTLSMVRRRQGRTADAEASCDAALAAGPESAEALSFLGELRADRGRFAEAAVLFQRAIEIDAVFPSAWIGIASHRKMTADDAPWLAGAQAALARPLPLRHEVGLRHAIGKYFDDIGEYDQAFASYRAANDLTKRYGTVYDRMAMSRRVDRQIARFDPPRLAAARRGGDDAELPLFIVGMPRSGTTLAEQILASHAEVFGAGELTFWDNAAAAFAAAGDPGAGQPGAGADLIARMAAACLERLRAIGGGARRVVDKMPANFLNLGLIHTVFPAARIIHMRRHPIDTCLSIYFQTFSTTHPYANDLDTLAHYYQEYVRMMDHWREVLPPATLLEVPYEALVADQEGWTRRMLEFAGLPWDPHCLDFHRTERVVITTSKWQVRQKMHKASAGRWRHYAAHVGPLHGLMSAAVE
jgi:tetratricopeptide (TPR) repeat protein